MLPADVYRPGRYPPGPNWPAFGDPYLQRAFRGISAEANANLLDKHERMRQLHQDRLDKQGFTSIPPPWQPPAEQPPALPAPGAGSGTGFQTPALEDTPQFQEALEWPHQLYDPNPENQLVVPRPTSLPAPEEPSGFMKQVGELADQAAGSVGGAISAYAVEKGTELALAAGAAPGLVAAGAMAAGAALAPVAKEVVKGAGNLALQAGKAFAQEQVNTFNLYKDIGKSALDMAYPNWRQKSPLELLIEIPKLTAQDIIRGFLSHEDLLTQGDTELLPIGRNVRDTPPWLAGSQPRNAQPALAMPTSRPQSYGPSNPPPLAIPGSRPQAQPSSSSSSSSSRPNQPNVPYTTYSDPDELLAKVKNKGALVEEIYKRPGWQAALGVANSKGYSATDQAEILRKKLLKMDRRELAILLVHLDTRNN